MTMGCARRSLPLRTHDECLVCHELNSITEESNNTISFLFYTLLVNIRFQRNLHSIFLNQNVFIWLLLLEFLSECST